MGCTDAGPVLVERWFNQIGSLPGKNNRGDGYKETEDVYKSVLEWWATEFNARREVKRLGAEKQWNDGKISRL